MLVVDDGLLVVRRVSIGRSVFDEAVHRLHSHAAGQAAGRNNSQERRGRRKRENVRVNRHHKLVERRREADRILLRHLAAAAAAGLVHVRQNVVALAVLRVRVHCVRASVEEPMRRAAVDGCTKCLLERSKRPVHR